MTELIVESVINETVIDIEGGPTLTTSVDETEQTIIQEFTEPIIVDLNSGPRGEPGAAILTGFHPPDTAEGVMGDMYIVTQGSVLVGQVFRKTSPATWTDVGNVRGPAGGVNTVNGYTGPDVILVKSDVGLGNVDNTSDANKPISTATQSALDNIGTTAVTLAGTQTITGAKTFNIAPVVPLDSFAIDKVSGLQAALDLKPATTTVVLLTGAQTIAGVKTFTSAPVVPDSSFAIAKVTDLANQLSLRAPLASPTFTGIITGNGSGLTALNGTQVTTGTVADARLSTNVVLLNNAQSITAAKTFTVSPSVPTPTLLEHAANKTYVDTSINQLISAAPGALDTLNELAAALGDDPNFATTMTTALAGKEPTLTASTTGQYYRGDKTWATLDKAAVGLANVDNTTDAAKPVSTATQTALNLKANLASPTFTGIISGNGSGLTTLNASNLSSGTILDARLSGNVMTLNNAQTVTAAKTFTVAPIVPDASFTIAKTSGLQAALDLKAPLASPTFTGTITGNGSGLTALNGTNISTGTVAVARLPTTVVHRVVYTGTAWPARPTGATYVEWVGPVNPSAATANDTWVNTGTW